MAGNTSFTLQEDGIDVVNYRKSDQLTKFLKRYADLDDEQNGTIRISFGDAFLILKKLREVKSSLASKLARVVKEHNDRQIIVTKARPVVAFPIDKNGKPLTRNCFVQYRFEDQACLENDIFFAHFIGMRDDGMALIKNDAFCLIATGNGLFRVQEDKDSTLWPIDLGRLIYEPRSRSEIIEYYRATEEDILRPVLPPDVERSGLKRKKKKVKKRSVISIGLTTE